PFATVFPSFSRQCAKLDLHVVAVGLIITDLDLCHGSVVRQNRAIVGALVDPDVMCGRRPRSECSQQHGSKHQDQETGDDPDSVQHVIPPAVPWAWRSIATPRDSVMLRGARTHCLASGNMIRCTGSRSGCAGSPMLGWSPGCAD